jgi:hypothetical protein
MEASAHNPAFARKVGIPHKVAAEYVAADKRNRLADAIERTPPAKR